MVYKRNLVLFFLPLALVLGLVAFHAGTSPARAADTTTAATGGSAITVNGTGTVEVAPDQALVTVGAEEDAATAAQAQAALAQDTAAMQKTILAAGIDQKDIATSGYDLSPSYDNNGKVNGYRASGYFTVTVNKLDSLGPFLDSMVAAGSNRINSIQFQRTDIAYYQRQALMQAVADAQAKAQAIASQLGKPLGPVTKVTESGPDIVPVYGRGFQGSMQEAGAAAPSTAVQPGQLQVTASVTLENSY